MGRNASSWLLLSVRVVVVVGTSSNVRVIVSRAVRVCVMELRRRRGVPVGDWAVGGVRTFHGRRSSESRRVTSF